MLQKIFCTGFFFLLSSLPLIFAEGFPPPAPTSIYDISAETIYGAKVLLSEYRGRVLLIVNIDVTGPLAKQLPELESLYKTFGEEGLSVLAFPSNDFITELPMTQDTVKLVSQQLTFPVFALTHVTGSYKNPVYQFLTDPSINPVYGGDVSWNFVKFLVNRDGQVIGRFNSTTSPEDKKLKEAIQKALNLEKTAESRFLTQLQ